MTANGPKKSKAVHYQPLNHVPELTVGCCQMIYKHS